MLCKENCQVEYLKYCLAKTEHTKDYFINMPYIDGLVSIKGYNHSVDKSDWYTYLIDKNKVMTIHKHSNENECIQELLNILGSELKGTNSKNTRLPSYKEYLRLKLKGTE